MRPMNQQNFGRKFMRVLTEKSAALIRAVLESYEDENLVTTSMMIRPEQKQLIKSLARENRVSQADIFRMMIDHWCETQTVESAA